MTNSQGRRQNANPELLELSDKEFQAVVITMLHEVKVNTHVMYRKIEVLNRKIENLKRIK